MSIARQRLGKHFPATTALKKGASIAGKRRCEHASLTAGDGVFREVLAEEL
jgi:hypothetical protein